MSDFDMVHDRRVVPALKPHPMVLGRDGVDRFAGGVADMDFAVAPAITAALRARADHAIYGYETMPEGLIPALVDWQRDRHGWQVDPDWVLRAPNALNALAIAAALFTEMGQGIIVQPPVFFDFFDVIREGGRAIVENPLTLRDGRYEMDFEGLEQLAARPEVRMLYLCNPHNPVGRAWSVQDLARLSDICIKHGVLVVSDDLHADIILPGGQYTPLASLGSEHAANTITLISPAKSFNIAGCCSSFTVIPDPAKRAQFQAENSRLTVNKNNAFASVAMEAAYRDGGPWLDEVLCYIAGNLDLLRARLDGFDGIELIEPEAGFLAWVDFRGLGMEPDALHEFLRNSARWGVTRGTSFGTGGAGFMRVNIACPRSVLEDALNRLEAALA